MKRPPLPKLEKIIDRFPRVKILVIGDLMLDEFIWGEVSRISPEAPVPVVEVKRESFCPGGASNVGSNIRALGGTSVICGVLGNDIHGRRLAEELRKQKVDLAGVILDSKRPTTLKTRIIAHTQQVVRVDREQIRPLASAELERMVAFVEKTIGEVDALILEDYGKGVIVPGLLEPVVALARRKKKIVTVDPKEEHFRFYRHVTAITPNAHEAGRAAGIKIVDEKSLLAAGARLLKRLKLKAALITRGDEGMTLFEASGKITHISTVAREVYDVTGAGDTVIGAFTLALAAGASMPEAAYLSNFAAGIVVGKVGVATATAEELKKALRGDWEHLHS